MQGRSNKSIAENADPVYYLIFFPLVTYVAVSNRFACGRWVGFSSQLRSDRYDWEVDGICRSMMTRVLVTLALDYMTDLSFPCRPLSC